MGIELLNPHVRHARRHLSRFTVRRGISKCYDARLFYLENVEGSITVDDVKYNVSNKTAVYLPPLSRYTLRFSFKENSSISVFNFDLTKEHTEIVTSLGTPTVSEFDPSLTPVCENIEGFQMPIVKRSSKIASYVYSAVKAFSPESDASVERASAYLKLALIELYEDEREYSPLCKKILAYVSDHLSEQGLTNADIASHFNYHPYYINRIIKSEVGTPLRSYIIDQRLDAAREGLLSSEDSVSLVAERAGFSSPSYFVKMFREREGITPLEYRRRNRSIEL